MSLADRVLSRYLEARRYTRPDNMVPVYNTDKERIVYVLPETIQEESGTYKRVPPSKLDTEGKPAPQRHPGQPRLPKKPKKPHRPELERHHPPAPVPPPIPPKHPLPAKPPKPVPPLKPPKVQEPSEPRRYKKVRRYLSGDDTQNKRVVENYLARLGAAGV